MIEVSPGDGAITVAVGDHFALFRHAQAAVDRPAGLSQNCPVRGSAAAAHRTTAAVEHLHGDALSTSEFHQLLLRLVQGPCGLEKAALFVAVGIADHHFLNIATQGQMLAIDGQGE